MLNTMTYRFLIHHNNQILDIYILVLVLATLCDYSMEFIDIGFNINLFKVASTYIITTEIVSIIENIGNLNSKLLPNKLKEIFLKLGDNEK